MKVLAVLAVLLCMFAVPCCAAESAEDMLEGVPMERLQSFSDENETGLDVSVLAGNALQGKIPSADKIIAYIKGSVSAPFRSAARDASAAVVPVLLLAVLGSTFPESSGGVGGARFVLYVAVLGTLSEIVLKALVYAENCMSVAKSFSDMIAPLLTALITAAGMNSSAALISPAAALAGNIIENVFSKYGVLACRYALALAAAGSLSTAIDFSAAVSGMKKAVNWCCGLAGTLFAALIALQNNVAASVDSAAVRTAKYTVDSITSIIGSGVSDAWNAYVSGVGIAKNALGVSGALALLAAGIRPVARILFSMLAINAVSVFLKIMGEKDAARAAEQLAGVCQMSLALSCGCVVIAMILISAVMFAGRGMLY